MGILLIEKRKYVNLVVMLTACNVLLMYNNVKYAKINFLDINQNVLKNVQVDYLKM